jgi:hypothetical protein
MALTMAVKITAWPKMLLGLGDTLSVVLIGAGATPLLASGRDS